MVGKSTGQSEDRLSLQSELSEISKVPPWIDDLAARYLLPENVQSAVNLCLEEVLSNVIRHGYRCELGRTVSVEFNALPDGHCIFVVDDEAPYFNPLEAPEMPKISPTIPIRIGGQGIRFLREFTSSLEYEPTPTGNRLRLCF
jgi:anti-sigma regulatory factor (Ser/Thr protein kinase)